jgi:hypothetical protein
MRIRGFSPYFSPLSSPDSRRSTDPVTQLWDLFSTGTPLCYIFDQLPEDAGFNKINNSSFDTEQYEANPDRVMKRAIALFAMQIREEKVAKEIPGCEPFTVTDLWDRNSTDGLVKVRIIFLVSQCNITYPSLQVINTVTAIVDHLPPDAFEVEPPSPPTFPENGSFDSLADTLASTPANAQESARNNIIKETVETERKYVQDLEIMQVSHHTTHESTPAHLSCDTEICYRPRPSQFNGSRHNSFTLSWSQQTRQLPKEIPHQTGEYRRTSLGRTTMGSSIHRECKSFLDDNAPILDGYCHCNAMCSFLIFPVIGRRICCV